MGPAHLQRAVKPESANAGRNLFQPHVASFFPRELNQLRQKRQSKALAAQRGREPCWFFFVLFDKLFMRVVFVTGFCNRVSALESRREGLNGGFVKAGSAFYRLIWPRNLATGAGLGCNPRNKKEKKQEKEIRVQSRLHRGNRFAAKKTTFAHCQRIALKVWVCFQSQRCSKACSGPSVSISTGRTIRQSL